MVTCKEITDYIEYAEKHPDWINKDRKLLIENVVKPTLARDDIYLDEETFQKCIRYCETHYYKLFLYQKFIYAFVFMYHKDTDAPLFPKIIILMGRGNGKDGMMAPLANFLQTPLYGVKNYNIELVANSESQIKDTFKIPFDMLYKNPKFKGKFKVTRELITNIQTGSELRYNTANSSTKDGKRPGCVFFNEYHAYSDYELINVFESGLGKVRHARIIIISTQGYVREGPLDDLLVTCQKILETGENELGYFPFICRLDDKKEADDQNAWHKANPSLEYMPILLAELKRQYLEAKEVPSKWPEFMTKRMNMPERKEEHGVASWENILYTSFSDIERRIPRDTPDTTQQLAIIGIDYADVNDFASCGVLTKAGDTYVWRQHTWISSHSPYLKGIKFPLANAGQPGFEDFEVVDTPTIPINAIVDYCLELMTQYFVVKITMDTYRYHLFQEVFQQAGISIESKQTPNGVVRLVRKIGSACGIVAPDIERQFVLHNIDFGQSAIMRWYTNNTAMQQDKFGNYMYIKINPERRKTDGFMAFVVAYFSGNLLKEQVVYV